MVSYSAIGLCQSVVLVLVSKAWMGIKQIGVDLGRFVFTGRGRPNECTWEAFATEDGALPTSIARSSDLIALASRLAHVEAYLKTLPPNLANFRPYIPPLTPTATPTEIVKQITKEETFSDTEDAAVDLENGVFGRSGLGRTSPAPSSTKNNRGVEEGTRSRRGTVSGRELRFGGKALELTKALTSIVAPDRLISAYSKAHLNVEFDASPADVERAWGEEQRRIYRALPNRAAIKHLVSLYFTKVSWLFHHLHAPSFFAELEAFDAMWDAGRLEEVDVFWVALLCIVSIEIDESTNS